MPLSHSVAPARKVREIHLRKSIRHTAHSGKPVVSEAMRKFFADPHTQKAFERSKRKPVKLPKLHVPALSVYGKDLDNLRESGVTDATIRANGLRTEYDKEKLARILNCDSEKNCCMGGLVIPYRDLAGNKVNCFARVRPHVPRVRDRKPIKYEQPKGSPLRAYFPKASRPRIRDGASPIYITEGEKKALALSQLDDVAAIGIGGVDCWGKGGELIDDLAGIEWTGRVVYVVFDYDEKAVTRRNVQSAARRLAKSLRAAGVNEVYNVELPPGPDNGKQGVDDFLVTNDEEAFWKLIEQAKPVDAPNHGERISSVNLITSTPPVLDEAAYHGIVGEFIRAVSPFTEATDAGILAHFLPVAGAYIGSNPFVVGGDNQPARINTALVGPTSTGRKGTAFGPVNKLMEGIDPGFWSEQYVAGLSSGEGLIQKVSDKRTQNDDGEWEVTPVEKRLYVKEAEFSRILMQTRRDGNILSQVLRETYDSGKLGVLTRNPLAADNAHISITGHITPEELQKRFSEIEMANGFGNRFLWFYVVSDKELPDGKPVSQKLLAKFATRLKRILRAASKRKRLARDEEASSLWKSVYSSLRATKPGLHGAMLARGESIVLRLSLIYALLDESDFIRREHLEAALAVWQYNEESVKALFKQKSGNTLADKLYRLLGNGPMMTKEFHKHTNEPAAVIREALGFLMEAGRIEMTKISPKGAGRPAEQWQRVAS